MHPPLTMVNCIEFDILQGRTAHRHGNLTIFVAYAPMEVLGDAVKDNFYKSVVCSSTSSSTARSANCAGWYHMNAESGTEDRSGNGVVGPFGFGAANDNNERLLSFCGSHNLTILGSWFCRLNIHRWSWLSRDITRKEIDHIITRSTDRLLFKNYRVLRSADSPVNSEHLLVMVKAEITC